MADRDTKGDLYEYMLGKIATAGQNGQFRTPRHIIKLMVEMTAPTPKDVICDPACGTAGFLVAASEYLREHHRDAIYKDAAAAPPLQRRHLPRLRLRQHHAAHRQHEHAAARRGEPGHPLPRLAGPGPTTDEAEKYSLVLANPPFAGSLDYESTAKDLQQIVKTKKTELLFLALFLRLLKPGGRAAVIVPDGVLFGSSKAHKDAAQDPGRGPEARRRRLACPRACSSPTPGSPPPSCSSPRPTPAAPTTSGSTTCRPTASASTTSAPRSRTRTTSPTSSPRWQNRARAEKQSATRRTDQSFLVPKAEIVGQRLRPLHQPLQGGGVRGGGVRPAEGDPGAAGEAGGGDRERA